MNSRQTKLCPSGTCNPDASLLGIVQSDGSIKLLPKPIKLTEEFTRKTSLIGEPERRFRFTNKCIQNGCMQWTGTRCGVMNRLAEMNPAIEEPPVDALPPCFIRNACRWYHQDGGKACTICLFVVTQFAPLSANTAVAQFENLESAQNSYEDDL